MLKKSMPDSICRIGVRQPRHFRYHLLFGNEINRKRWVDQEVNLPEERRPRRSMETRVFRYRIHIGKEIKRNITSILKIHKRKCLERIGLKELRGLRGLKNNTIITMSA